jgi:hypothetical protein
LARRKKLQKIGKEPLYMKNGPLPVLSVNFKLAQLETLWFHWGVEFFFYQLAVSAGKIRWDGLFSDQGLLAR